MLGLFHKLTGRLCGSEVLKVMSGSLELVGEKV